MTAFSPMVTDRFDTTIGRYDKIWIYLFLFTIPINIPGIEVSSGVLTLFAMFVIRMHLRVYREDVYYACTLAAIPLLSLVLHPSELTVSLAETIKIALGPFLAMVACAIPRRMLTNIKPRSIFIATMLPTTALLLMMAGVLSSEILLSADQRYKYLLDHVGTLQQYLLFLFVFLALSNEKMIWLFINLCLLSFLSVVTGGKKLFFSGVIIAVASSIRNIKSFVAVALGVIFIGLAFTQALMDLDSPIVRPIKRIGEALSNNEVYALDLERIELMRGAYNSIIRHPILGTGIAVLAQRQKEVHSSIIFMTEAIGIPMALLYLGCFARWFLTVSRGTTVPRLPLLLIVLALVFFGETVVLWRSEVYWMCLGTTFALIRHHPWLSQPEIRTAM